jgi:hypothetical protein
MLDYLNNNLQELRNLIDQRNAYLQENIRHETYLIKKHQLLPEKLPEPSQQEKVINNFFKAFERMNTLEAAANETLKPLALLKQAQMEYQRSVNAKEEALEQNKKAEEMHSANQVFQEQWDKLLAARPFPQFETLKSKISILVKKLESSLDTKHCGDEPEQLLKLEKQLNIKLLELCSECEILNKNLMEKIVKLNNEMRVIVNECKTTICQSANEDMQEVAHIHQKIFKKIQHTSSSEVSNALVNLSVFSPNPPHESTINSTPLALNPH